jgi:outer membrane protein TolC
MELGAVRNQLAFGAVRAFNLIIQAQGVVKAHQAALEAIDASLAVARARYREGVLLRADLLNLEVQESGSRENLVQAENALAVAHRIFLNLLGLNEGRVAIAPGPVELQEIPATRDYAQRYELASAAAMVRAAEAGLRLARGGNYPTLDGYAAYDLDQGFETDGSGSSWQAGIRLNYNLFDGHRTSAAVSMAAARLAEAREQQRQLELAIGLEVTRAELALSEAENRLQVSEKAVEQAQESARIYRARFKEGEVLASDLISVEKGLTDAQLRRTLAETARRIAIADLRRALGEAQFPDLEEEAGIEEVAAD